MPPPAPLHLAILILVAY